MPSGAAFAFSPHLCSLLAMHSGCPPILLWRHWYWVDTTRSIEPSSANVDPPASSQGIQMSSSASPWASSGLPRRPAWTAHTARPQCIARTSSARMRASSPKVGPSVCWLGRDSSSATSSATLALAADIQAGDSGTPSRNPWHILWWETAWGVQGSSRTCGPEASWLFCRLCCP